MPKSPRRDSLAELVAAGLSPSDIERHLAAWSKYLPTIERPLQQLSLIAGGKKLLARGDDGLVGPGGQTYFEFLDPNGATYRVKDAARPR